MACKSSTIARARTTWCAFSAANPSRVTPRPPSSANQRDDTLVADARFLILKRMQSAEERQAYLEQVRIRRRYRLEAPSGFSYHRALP